MHAKPNKWGQHVEVAKDLGLLYDCKLLVVNFFLVWVEGNFQSNHIATQRKRGKNVRYAVRSDFDSNSSLANKIRCGRVF